MKLNLFAKPIHLFWGVFAITLVACMPKNKTERDKNEGPVDPDGITFAIFADSIGTATLGDTSADKGDEFVDRVNAEKPGFLEELLGHIRYGNNIAITKMFGQLGVPENAAYSSAADWAFPAKLRTEHNRAIKEVITVADAGDLLIDIKDSMIQLEAKTSESPELILMAMGHLDFCRFSDGSESSVDEIVNHFKIALEMITSKYQNSEVLVMLPLNIPSFASITGNVEAPRNNFTYSCPAVLAAACPVVNKLPLEQLVVHKAYYDTKITEAAQEVATNYAGSIKILEQPSQVQVNINNMAVDCFHPNFEAQQTLAKTLSENYKTAQPLSKGE